MEEKTLFWHLATNSSEIKDLMFYFLGEKNIDFFQHCFHFLVLNNPNLIATCTNEKKEKLEQVATRLGLGNVLQLLFSHAKDKRNLLQTCLSASCIPLNSQITLSMLRNRVSFDCSPEEFEFKHQLLNFLHQFDEKYNKHKENLKQLTLQEINRLKQASKSPNPLVRGIASKLSSDTIDREPAVLYYFSHYVSYLVPIVNCKTVSHYIPFWDEGRNTEWAPMDELDKRPLDGRNRIKVDSEESDMISFFDTIYSNIPKDADQQSIYTQIYTAIRNRIIVKETTAPKVLTLGRITTGMCSEMSILFKAACDYLRLEKGLDVYASLIRGYHLLDKKHAWNFVLIGNKALLADMRKDKDKWLQEQTDYYQTNSKRQFYKPGSEKGEPKSILQSKGVNNQKITNEIQKFDSVVIKQGTSIGSFSENLQREGFLCQVLRHRNVVKVHYVSMETNETQKIYCKRFECNLREYEKELKGRWEKKQITPYEFLVEWIFIFLDVAQGISYIQQHNVMHRDVKPENILISTFKNEKQPENKDLLIPRVKHACLTDFDVSKMCDNENELHHSALVGSPLFMAPCVKADLFFIGKKLMARYDESVDIYSLGCTFDECMNWWLGAEKRKQFPEELHKIITGLTELLGKCKGIVCYERPTIQSVVQELYDMMVELYEMGLKVQL